MPKPCDWRFKVRSMITNVKKKLPSIKAVKKDLKFVCWFNQEQDW